MGVCVGNQELWDVEYFRSGDVGHTSGRFGEGELGEAGGDLAYVYRLERSPRGTGVSGRRARLFTMGRTKSCSCAARTTVHGTPESSMVRSAAAFARKYPIGILSAPTTEMRIRCETPADLAASARFCAAISSPLAPHLRDEPNSEPLSNDPEVMSLPVPYPLRGVGKPRPTGRTKRGTHNTSSERAEGLAAKALNPLPHN